MPSASLRVPSAGHAVPSHGGGGSESWEEESYGSSQGGGGHWRGGGGAATVLSALREVCATCEDALNEAGGDYISFELQPEYVLKLRKRTPLVTLGLNLETHAQGYELVAKRGTQDLPLWKFVRRIVAAPDRGEVRVHSVALPLGMLAVEGTVTHDLRVHKSRLSWRLCASWDVGPHHAGRKHRLPSPTHRVKPALRWDVRTLAQPELEGQLGDSTGVQYDIGRFHVSLPTVQATIEL